MKNLIKNYEDRFGRMVIYLAYGFFSLLAATVLFGVLHSTGFVKLVFPDYIKEAEFGGAAALFILTLIFLVRSHEGAESGQASASGNVENEQGQAVKGVKIRVQGDRGSVQSDADGHFMLKLDAGQGEWELVAEHKDYEPVSQVVNKAHLRKPVVLVLKKK